MKNGNLRAFPGHSGIFYVFQDGYNVSIYIYMGVTELNHEPSC